MSMKKNPKNFGIDKRRDSSDLRNVVVYLKQKEINYLVKWQTANATGKILKTTIEKDYPQKNN